MTVKNRRLDIPKKKHHRLRLLKKASVKKAMKAKKVSVIAKGKRAKSAVFLGSKEKTYTGLQKDDLMKSKTGKIVTKKSHAAGLKAFQYIKVWNSAVRQARAELQIYAVFGLDETGGFYQLEKGRPLYQKAKEIYDDVFDA